MSRIFPTKPTVDSIITRFQRTVEDLRNLANSNSAEAAEITATINDLTLTRADINREVQRANKIATNLETLLK